MNCATFVRETSASATTMQGGAPLNVAATTTRHRILENEQPTLISIHYAILNRISELIIRAGLGMEENAGLLGVNARTVRRHINGEGKIPTN